MRAPTRNRPDIKPFARQPDSTKPAASTFNFPAINRAALASIGAVLARLLPGGRVVGGEYLALNPRRADTHLGSFKVRMIGARAGCWADFALGDRGGDIVSLVAYLAGVSQGEAARLLAQMLGIETGGRRHG